MQLASAIASWIWQCFAFLWTLKIYPLGNGIYLTLGEFTFGLFVVGLVLDIMLTDNSSSKKGK